MASEKTQVIEWLFFNKKFDTRTSTLIDPVVTMVEINEAIRVTGANLKPGANRANFWKDLTRDGDKGLNRTWPDAIFARGFVGGDAIGQRSGAVFMFLPAPPGQLVPFVDGILFNDQLPVVQLQSLSMPQAMKELARPG